MKYSEFLQLVKESMNEKYAESRYCHTCNCIKWTAGFDGSLLAHKTKALNYVAAILAGNYDDCGDTVDTYLNLFKIITGRYISHPEELYQFQLYMINRMIGEAKLEESQAKGK